MKQKIFTKVFIFDLIKLSLNSIMSGIMLSLAGAACILSPVIGGSKIVGSFVFAFGLMMIIIFNYNLFTGMIAKIPYTPLKKSAYTLPICFIFNTIGTLMTVFLFSLTPLNESLTNATTLIMSTKLINTPVGVLVSGVFCGICISLACIGYKDANEKKLSPTLTLIFPIMIFVLCGFEHSVANMFYILMSNQVWDLPLLLFVLMAVIGNIVGGVLIPYIKIFITKSFDKQSTQD